MKITPEGQITLGIPCDFTLHIRTTEGSGENRNEVSVTFNQPLTLEEERELAAWLIKVQDRIRSVARPPFSFQTESVYGTPTDISSNDMGR